MKNPHANNLPPGVSLRDVDGSDECPACDGSGVVDDETDPGVENLMVTCPRCGGLGVRESTRGAKFTDDMKPGE